MQLFYIRLCYKLVIVRIVFYITLSFNEGTKLMNIFLFFLRTADAIQPIKNGYKFFDDLFSWTNPWFTVSVFLVSVFCFHHVDVTSVLRLYVFLITSVLRLYYIYVTSLLQPHCISVTSMLCFYYIFIA